MNEQDRRAEEQARLDRIQTEQRVSEQRMQEEQHRAEEQARQDRARQEEQQRQEEQRRQDENRRQEQQRQDENRRQDSQRQEQRAQEERRKQENQQREETQRQEQERREQSATQTDGQGKEQEKQSQTPQSQELRDLANTQDKYERLAKSGYYDEKRAENAAQGKEQGQKKDYNRYGNAGWTAEQVEILYKREIVEPYKAEQEARASEKANGQESKKELSPVEKLHAKREAMKPQTEKALQERQKSKELSRGR